MLRSVFIGLVLSVVANSALSDNSGPCGGWYKDKNQQLVCCSVKARPVCFNSGLCTCRKESSCKGNTHKECPKS